MKVVASFAFLVLLVVAVFTVPTRALPAAQEPAGVDRALGRWRSVEQFEDEARITVAFRQSDRSIVGWAVLLGQHRKSDDRATLALSFAEASWNGQSMRFSTILPEDEGTIGWELQLMTPTTAVLRALTEDGKPMPDDLKWDMVR